MKTRKLMPPSFKCAFHAIALVQMRLRVEKKQGALSKEAWSCVLSFTNRSWFCGDEINWLDGLR
jgi:hypothetical protein